METGRVIFQAKDLSKVLLADGRILLGQVSGKFRQQAAAPSDYPIVGDLVSGTCFDNDHLLIETIHPRHSFLQRKVAGNRLDQQGIAANIHTVFITTSANEEFNLPRLERFTTIVWDSGAMPVFVLTKTDLVTAAQSTHLVRQLEQRFIGIPVITTDHLSDPWEKFQSYLQAEQVVTFIGSSGVGKSTLLNQFLGRRQQATKDIRQEDARGRHTTTSRQLFVLENGAMIIDTPGMREISLDTVSSAALTDHYQEIYDLAATCRFKNCRHDSEPGCAVKRALSDGRLSRELMNSYRKMEKEIAYLEKKERIQRLLKR